MARLEQLLGIEKPRVSQQIDPTKIYQPPVADPTAFQKAGRLVGSRLEAGNIGTAAGLQGAVQGLIGKGEQLIDYWSSAPTPSASAGFGQLGQTQEFQQAQQRAQGFQPTSKPYQYYGELAKIGEQKAQTARERYTPETKTGQFVGGLIESGPAMAGAAALTAAGVPQAGASLLGASSGGREFRQAQQEGATFQQAFESGAISGGAEAILSTLSLKALEDLWKAAPKPLVQKGLKYATAVLSEATEEGATEAISILGQKLTYDKDKGFDLAQIGEAAAGGAVMALFFGALGDGSQTAINALRKGEVTKADIDTIAEEQGTTVEAVEEQAVETVEPVAETVQNINQYKTLEQLKQGLADRNLDTVGTKSELRSRLKTALDTETQQVTPESAVEGRVEAIKAQQPSLEQRLGMPEVQGFEQQLVSQANTILENLTTENLDASVRQLKIIKNQADKRGIPMNLQLFAEAISEDISILEDLAIEPKKTKKFRKAYQDLISKGVTKATLDEFLKLADTTAQINELKAKHTEQIAAVKERYKARREAMKESKLRSKLLDVSKRMQRGRMQPEFQAVANELFGNIDTLSKSISSKKRIELEQTLKTIDKLKNEGIEVDPDLENAVARLNRKQIADMEISEVEELIDVAKNLEHLNRTKNQTLQFERGEKIAEIAGGMVQQLQQQPSRKARKAQDTGEFVENNRFVDSLSLFMGKPANTLRTLMYEVGRGNDNSAAVRLGNTVSERQSVELNNRDMLNTMLDEAVGEDYKKLASSKEWNKEQDVNGRKMSSGQKVYLKLALNDANVLRSLEEMGYRRKGKIQPSKISKEEIQAIQLSPKEQQVYDVANQFFDQTYNLLNKAYLQLNGYKLYKNPDGYLPKVVSDITLREELGQVMRPGGLKNTGVVQSRKGTINELLLPDILDLYSRQTDIATKYNAYVNLVQDASKIFSKPELRKALRTEYGIKKTKGAKEGKSIVEEYMDDLFQDLQGTKSAKPTRGEGFFRLIRTKGAPAILAYRATTPLLQTASYPMAVTQIDPKNLAKGLKGKANFDEAAQYNARAKARTEGRIDRELAEAKVGKLVEYGLKPIQFMDKKTIGKLWNATKLQVAQETNLTGEQLLQEAGRRFDKVLDTQPNYTTADRSMTMRSQSELDKTLTMFSSAKSAVLNELKRGYVKGKYTGNWDELIKASSGLITSIVMMAGISNLMKRAKGDEEAFTESLIKRATGALPGLDAISSLLNGYGVSNIGADAVEDMAKSATSLLDLVARVAKGDQISEQKVVKTFWNTIDSVALMLGVPVETLRDDLQIIINQLPFDDAKQQFKRFTDPYSKSEYYDKLINYITSDNTDAANALLTQAENAGVKRDNLINNMQNKLKDGTIEEEDYDVFKKLKEIRNVK